VSRDFEGGCDAEISGFAPFVVFEIFKHRDDFVAFGETTFIFPTDERIRDAILPAHAGEKLIPNMNVSLAE
jgi:hypothetical protein